MDFDLNPFFSDSDTDSDDVNIPNSRVLAPRRYPDRPNLFDNLSDYEFRNRFRLSKSTILDLAELLDPILKPRPRSTKHAVSTINQILVTLKYVFHKYFSAKVFSVDFFGFRFYATGVFQQVNGDLFKLAQPTVSRIINRATKAICSLRPQLIAMPASQDEMRAIKQKFYSLVQPHGIPNVIGCIDGTHVKIYSPGGEDAEHFRNRKGYFSINVQAVGGPDLRALDVEARWPGSSHDSYIFDMSFVKVTFAHN